MKEINKYIDHTLLSPNASLEDIRTLCDEAKQYHFYAVCVNSSWIRTVSNELKGSDVKIVATVGFPFGAASTKAKVIEAISAIKDGANEIDMVMNIGLLKSDLTKETLQDISAVKKAIGKNILKVIIEINSLTKHEVKMACIICKMANADYIKTSTGFGSKDTRLKDIQMIKSSIGTTTKIKVSGDISSKEEAIAFIRSGVDRIATSKSVDIIFFTKEKQF